MTGRCTRWERWLTGSGGPLKVLNWNLQSFQLFRDNSSFGLNILGPLCLWQCFISDGWNRYLPGQDQKIEGARLTLNGKI